MQWKAQARVTAVEDLDTMLGIVPKAAVKGVSEKAENTAAEKGLLEKAGKTEEEKRFSVRVEKGPMEKGKFEKVVSAVAEKVLDIREHALIALRSGIKRRNVGKSQWAVKTVVEKVGGRMGWMRNPRRIMERRRIAEGCS